ncbi:hypothetical protein SERLADRAFT_414553 [Serpula lacrymans var. lacrymans S7.9]|uniref:Uncharacterized protein n=1 Tax=Serpula lacrymans var. lacrymans (strain S7.9) TaxID=578457 RepID=F8NQB6_SERL9|nr:uncharacterized protein SERLADRAFT_414553 [Serpula lacrymans var. lacrymans S7.9]EGO26576.1 hypothetical protein SERLADRAFT_414553 [Serpula lacrymans var. lacrymans S7.9]
MSEQKLATPLPTNPSTPQQPSFQLNRDAHNTSSGGTVTPKSAFAFQTSSTPLSVPQVTKSITPELLAANELMANMKATLTTLGRTFDCLGEQTYRISALGPAIQGSHQVSLIRTQLNAQHERQEARMQEVKILLRDVLKAQLAQHLNARVDTMVHERIEREVKERVTKQVQTNIYNSEARRHNALLGSNTVHEALCPLLRPLRVTTLSDQEPKATSLRVLAYELPTPSSLFPHNLSALLALSYETTKALVSDYDLDHEMSFDTKGSEGGSEWEHRDMYLSHFMAHIGVPFQVVSASPSHALLTARWR